MSKELDLNMKNTEKISIVFYIVIFSVFIISILIIYLLPLSPEERSLWSIPGISSLVRLSSKDGAIR